MSGCHLEPPVPGPTRLSGVLNDALMVSTQAPAVDRYLSGWTDFAISRPCGSVNFGGRSPWYFGYSEVSPVGVEVPDHITEPVLAGKRHPRDRGYGHPLSR